MGSRDGRLLPLYIGGFMGPFGTVVIVPMFPELRESFDASSGAVGLGFTLYFLPFALLLTVSGTVGERLGRRRTVRATYLTYAVASIGCALAPNLATFLAARLLQGAANAFITPLLVAGLADVVPDERLGRSVGVYSSFQAVGTGLGPVIGGLAADTNWRWAFVFTAAAALVLAAFPPPGEPRVVERPPVRPLLSRRMITLGAAVFAAAMGPIGAAFLIGVFARDELDLSGGQTGVVLVLGAASAFALGPVWGRLLDEWGTRRAGLVSSIAVSGVVAAIALVDSAVPLALLWVVGSAAAAFVVVVFQGEAARAVPGNRGGAVSSIMAWRFAGHGIGPAILLPIFESSTDAAFLIAGGLGLFTMVGLLASTGPGRRGDR